jgi:hypothetical protein
LLIRGIPAAFQFCDKRLEAASTFKVNTHAPPTFHLLCERFAAFIPP